jgi:glycosyl transferase family 25
MTQAHVDGLLVLLINLDRSDSRLSQMQQRLSKLGLHYERLSAVDGKLQWQRLKETVNITAFERNVGRDIMPGEIGCYHSHLQAWQQLLSSDAKTLLVLEDDVVFGADFLSALKLALVHSQSWDMLNLNKIRAKQPIRLFHLDAYALNAYVGPLTGMGAYLIHKEVAARLLPQMLPIELPIDLELDRVHKFDLRRYGLEPFPSAVQDNDESTITGLSFGMVKKYPWFKRFPVFGRRLTTLVGKTFYLLLKGRFFPKKAIK